MGIFSPLYNLVYATAFYTPEETVEFRPEETQRLPALPLDIWRYYTKRDGRGGFNTVTDARFTRDKRNNAACRINFSVWKHCLAQHSEDRDPEDPAAAICKRYHKNAMNSCYSNLFQKFEKDYNEDVWMGIVGLNTRDQDGSNPSWLYVNGHGEIISIVNKNKNDPQDYHVGGHYKPSMNSI